MNAVFNYTKGEEMVTEVDSEAFRVCNRQGNMINEWSSGDDVVFLNMAGRHWFFSSLGNHCDLGLKLVVDVDVQLIETPEPGPAPSTLLPLRRPPPTAPVASPPVSPPSPETSSAALHTIVAAVFV
nr:unnamed protein product [Digitaria exilis]